MLNDKDLATVNGRTGLLVDVDAVFASCTKQIRRW